MEPEKSGGTLILDGKETAKMLKAEVANEVAAFKEQYGRVPGLAIITVGEDPSIMSYTNAVLKSFDGVGMATDHRKLPEDATAATLHSLIKSLNDDPNVTAIIVGQPLPKHLPLTVITDVLSP